MKKILLGKHTFYKANLHTHTNISDGQMSPQEIKDGYMQNGYSVVAFTDHEVFVPHNDLTDKNFLAINSYELAVNERKEKDFQFIKTYHLNFYAMNDQIEVAPCFNVNNIWLKQSLPYVTEKMKGINYPIEYSVECINQMIARSNEEGFLVCYNHPVWSQQTYADYADLKGLWGIEVFNTGCDNSSLTDTDRPYEDLLKVGEKLYPVSADDTHKPSSRFGGFTMIDAPNLMYNDVMQALKTGDFYASTGPLINALWIEDDFLKIRCSPCCKIMMLTNRRYTETVRGTDITEAQISLKTFFKWNGNDENGDYFRLVIVDKEGKKAHTRAYRETDFYG